MRLTEGVTSGIRSRDQGGHSYLPNYLPALLLLLLPLLHGMEAYQPALPLTTLHPILSRLHQPGERTIGLGCWSYNSFFPNPHFSPPIIWVTAPFTQMLTSLYPFPICSLLLLGSYLFVGHLTMQSFLLEKTPQLPCSAPLLARPQPRLWVALQALPSICTLFSVWKVAWSW